ncbi:MAG TPA: hypothetical protein VIH82_00055 [Acidimicrobiia bacterium]
MARRHAFAAVLVAALLVIAGSLLHVGPGPAPPTSLPIPLGAGHTTLHATGPDDPEAVVAERPERATEASTSDRRSGSRDHRVPTLVAVLGLGVACIGGLSAAMARRRLRRAPTRTRRIVPARAPPLLASS